MTTKRTKNAQLTNANYFTDEMNRRYMSVSQFKSFRECEAKALAEIAGAYVRPETKALQMGSYVDAYFSGEDMAMYRETHPEIVNSRTGALKADFTQCLDIINAARTDEMFMHYVMGEGVQHQVILTGELFGVEWKVKIDALYDDMIVDFKLMKDMDPVWKDGVKKTFIDAWDYPLQGYVYREIVKQNTGKELPFYLAVMTKEEPSDREIIEIPSWRLNTEEAVVEHYVQRFADLKAGKAEPTRCGKCAWCRGSKRLTRVKSYDDLVEELGGKE